MPRSLLFAVILTFFAAFSAAAQSQDSTASPLPAQSQDSPPPAEAKKPKKVWTNEDLHGAKGGVSVVGDSKNNNPKPASSKPANAQYVASVRKQLDKLQGEIADIDKQLVDLKNFSEGEPSTSASGVQLNKSYQREPIEVQMRALQYRKKDLESKVDALLDEARKKGVESNQLR
jgi:hypothetical protein